MSGFIYILLAIWTSHNNTKCTGIFYMRYAMQVVLLSLFRPIINALLTII